MGAKCTHTDVKPVLTIGGCEVWGGKESQVMPKAGKFDVIISLLGSVKSKQTKFTLTRGSRRVFANLVAYQQKRNNVICIDWPDMQSPELDRAFWEAMVADLKNVQGNAAIFCMGGHGRTGTALSALAHLSEYGPAMESGDIIDWVRENYCEDAVETASQIYYLRNVIGIATKSEASRSWGPTVKGGSEEGASRYFKGNLFKGTSLGEGKFDDDYENFRGD